MFFKLDTICCQCSKTCGVGSKRRHMYCSDSIGQRVHEGNCANYITPRDKVPCYEASCSTHWWTGSWSTVGDFIICIWFYMEAVMNEINFHSVLLLVGKEPSKEPFNVFVLMRWLVRYSQGQIAKCLRNLFIPDHAISMHVDLMLFGSLVRGVR